MQRLRVRPYPDVPNWPAQLDTGSSWHEAYVEGGSDRKAANMGGFCYPATDLTGCHNLRSRSTHAHLVDCGEGRYDKRGAEGQDQCSEDQSRAHSGLPANISPPETHFHPSGRFNSMRQ